MPELPEVRNSAFYINKDVAGKTIKSVEIRVEKMIKNISTPEFINQVKNKKITKVGNKAKFLIFSFDDGTKMLSHLRMEGKYRFEKKRNLNKHDHVIFGFDDGFLIFNDTRKFGTFEIKNKDNYLNTLPLSKLGEIPGKAKVEEVFEKLQKKRIAIKSALLDQTIISGLGNIYVDEVLNITRTNPEKPSNKITIKKLREILESAQKILDDATKKGGSSIKSYLSYNKISGNYQNFLRAHMKSGENCKNEGCLGKVEKIKVNGRGTYRCNLCQKNTTNLAIKI